MRFKELFLCTRGPEGLESVFCSSDRFPIVPSHSVHGAGSQLLQTKGVFRFTRISRVEHRGWQECVGEGFAH